MQTGGTDCNKRKTNDVLILIAVAAGLFVFQSVASKTGSLVAGLFDYSAVDKDGVFMRITVHHVVQMLIALAAVIVTAKLKKVDFYIRPKFSKTGICYTAVFSVAIAIYALASYVVGYRLNRIAPYEYELSPLNIAGSLGFQLLLSGTSEEILFRAFPITILELVSRRMEHKVRLLNIVIASFLFSLAHIKLSAVPFAVSFSWFQLIYAFILGIAYGIALEKSNSVLYPAVMHGMSNFIMVGVGYIFALT